MDIFIYVIVFFIVFPFVLTGIIFLINKWLGVHPLKAFHRSMAWSTIFYILAVIQMFMMFFQRIVFGVVVGLFLCVLSFIIIQQRKNQSDIDLRRAIRVLWRLCFVLFALFYFLLVMYGMIIRL